MSQPTMIRPTVDKVMQTSAYALVATVWTSALIFGLYILTFYFIALLRGNTEQWNEVLPGLFDRSTRTATLGIGLHFAAGGIILILGCIQLIKGIRVKYPAIHRWLGRLYVAAALLTAIGGLVFIFVKGTIGGWPMDLAFAGYGIAMFVTAIATIYYARAGQMDHHRAWAIRLFALAIGSWLYRMDYGFWFLFTGGWGHTGTFDGPFDYFMDWWFYVPNLLVAEVFIAKRAFFRSSIAKWVASGGLIIATLFLVLATYFFTIKLWGPAILGASG
ncbi:MAG: DUF2306 domain-containing protein [Bacteroidota bacterium]